MHASDDDTGAPRRRGPSRGNGGSGGSGSAGWRRRLWPVAPALLVLSAANGLILGTAWDAPTAPAVALSVVPLLAAAWIAGRAFGGRRGWIVTAGLVALGAYWAWWFGWGVEFSGEPFSFRQLADGLFDAADYHVGLAILLWPLVLGAAALVAVVARRLRRPVWSSLGLLALALVVLAFPRDATWTDGCNGGGGASPLITQSTAGWLMDHGVGVIPSSSMTLKSCGTTDDLDWKPFWLGGDGLPAGRGLGSVAYDVQIPAALYRDPAPLPGRRLEHVAVGYDPAARAFFVVMRTDRRLLRPGPGREMANDVRIRGVRADQAGAQGERGGAGGWCYEFVSVGRSRSELLPESRGERALARVTLEHRGRLLGAARRPVTVLRDRAVDLRDLRRRFGCRSGG